LFFASAKRFRLLQKPQHFTIKGGLFDKAKESDDCVFLLLSYLHDKRNSNKVPDYQELAGEKNEGGFDRYWLFVYEVLGKNELNEPYKSMKSNGVSFVRSFLSGQ
jgi:hypothetical protein